MTQTRIAWPGETVSLSRLEALAGKLAMWKQAPEWQQRLNRSDAEGWAEELALLMDMPQGWETSNDDDLAVILTRAIQDVRKLDRLVTART